MSSFNIAINAGQDTVELPAFLAHAKDLSLEEIGMIFLIASIPCDQDPSITFEKMGQDENEAMKSLKQKGILSASVENKKVTMRLDLDVIELMEASETDDSSENKTEG